MTTAMTLRIDAEIKKEATKYLEQLGLSTSEALRLFLYSVVRHKGLPFAKLVQYIALLLQEIPLPPEAHDHHEI